jgi:hypothetical protein
MKANLTAALSIPKLALSRRAFHISQNSARPLLKNSLQHLPRLAKLRSTYPYKHLYFNYLQHSLKSSLKTLIRYILKE